MTLGTGLLAAFVRVNYTLYQEYTKLPPHSADYEGVVNFSFFFITLKPRVE